MTEMPPRNLDSPIFAQALREGFEEKTLAERGATLNAGQ